MYNDLSTSDAYPKTLLIRNTSGGMIWQVYHVKNETEAIGLAKNASKNAFEGITLENYQPSYEETWPGWRVDAQKDIIEKDYILTEEDINLHTQRLKQEDDDYWENVERQQSNGYNS